MYNTDPERTTGEWGGKGKVDREKAMERK